MKGDLQVCCNDLCVFIAFHSKNAEILNKKRNFCIFGIAIFRIC